MSEKTEFREEGMLRYPITLTYCDGPNCEEVCYGPGSLGWIEVRPIGHDVRALCDHPWGRFHSRSPAHFHRIACLKEFFEGVEKE